jgi:hypothetical protein
LANYRKQGPDLYFRMVGDGDGYGGAFDATLHNHVASTLTDNSETVSF